MVPKVFEPLKFDCNQVTSNEGLERKSFVYMDHFRVFVSVFEFSNFQKSSTHWVPRYCTLPTGHIDIDVSETSLRRHVPAKFHISFEAVLIVLLCS